MIIIYFDNHNTLILDDLRDDGTSCNFPNRQVPFEYNYYENTNIHHFMEFRKKCSENKVDTLIDIRNSYPEEFI